MQNIVQTVEKKKNVLVLVVKRNASLIINVIIKLSIILSFVIPFWILYSLAPVYFERTWIGRTFYLFFLWLIFLEIILDWEKLQNSKLKSLKSIRTAAFVVALSLPLLYVIAGNYWGLNVMIRDSAMQNNIVEHNATLLPIGIEYVVFAALFGLIILSAQGFGGLMDFSTSIFFLGVIGAMYIIDNLYPYGKFTPFQIFVPATATLAASMLHFMGYSATVSYSTSASDLQKYGPIPSLTVSNSTGAASFGIAWACSGVESLLIYTVVILLFLKKSDIPLWHRVIYFVIGALVTYFLNIVRIATIFVIAINRGDWQLFHDYYGLMYSVVWITCYPLIIIGSQVLWGRVKSWRTGRPSLISQQRRLQPNPA
jgi:exosortase/archaeosortase family protein